MNFSAMAHEQIYHPFKLFFWSSYANFQKYHFLFPSFLNRELTHLIKQCISRIFVTIDLLKNLKILVLKVFLTDFSFTRNLTMQIKH